MGDVRGSDGQLDVEVSPVIQLSVGMLEDLTDGRCYWFEVCVGDGVCRSVVKFGVVCDLLDL